MSDETVVVDDPDWPSLPIGCIGAAALLSLAAALDSLETWHRSVSGAASDKPCLRRLESADGIVTAHVSIGHIVGRWEKLILTQAGWQIT